MAQGTHLGRERVWSVVMYGCVLFVVLTAAAMWFYPGGTLADPNTSGYSFSTNFLSELGIRRTRAGKANTISAALWFAALSLAGAGLMLFFGAFRRFFTGSRWGRRFSAMGTATGVAAGICFIAVALTPADSHLQAHMMWLAVAFTAFPIAAICYAAAILREPNYPKRYGYVFWCFAGLLAVYVALMMAGPGASSREAMMADSPGRGSLQALMIQAIGQKVIVYVSMISILYQTHGAREMTGRRLGT